MVSANVSGRGTPNVSGRDTPSSQVTEGEEGGQRSGVETRPTRHDSSVSVPKSARADIEEKFGRFEIKPIIGGDETVSLVSDTWSTDVLASDSETIEAVDRDGRGDQFHEQLLNRHLEELDRMSGARDDFLGGDVTGEPLDTASEAWSTDVLASDSERLTEFDTDDAQSVARSDDAGRSEVEMELCRGDSNLRHDSQRLGDDDVAVGSPDDLARIGGCAAGGRPGLAPASLSLDSGSATNRNAKTATVICVGEDEDLVLPSSAPPTVGFKPIDRARNNEGLLMDVIKFIADEQLTDIVAGTQSLGRLSLNLSELPNNGIVRADEPLVLNEFVGKNGSFDVRDVPPEEDDDGTEASADVRQPEPAAEDGISVEDGGLRLSTNSLASSSSSGSDGGARKRGTASFQGSDRSIDRVDSQRQVARSEPNSSSTGAIPKSISFDKTAERGDRDATDSESKHKRGFFKTFKLPGFNKGRRKTSGRGVDEVGQSRQSLASLESSIGRRPPSDDGRPPTIVESSDDILAKYRNKKSDLDISEPDSRLHLNVDSM